MSKLGPLLMTALMGAVLSAVVSFILADGWAAAKAEYWRLYVVGASAEHGELAALKASDLPKQISGLEAEIQALANGAQIHRSNLGVANDSLAQCQSNLANLTDAQTSRLATLAATQEALAKEQNALDVCLAAAAPPASVPHPVAKPWHRAPLHNPLDDAYDPLAGHCR